jgi:hypothetical protein
VTTNSKLADLYSTYLHFSLCQLVRQSLIQSGGALAWLIFSRYTAINAFDRNGRILDPEDEGTLIFRQAGECLPTDIAKDPRRLKS